MKSRILSVVSLVALLVLLASTLPAGAVKMQEAETATVSFLAEMDTYINAWAPDASYGDGFNFSVRQPGVMSGLVQFDLSSIPQFATVHDAQLKLYATYRTNTNQLNLYAYPVVGPWDEGVTWNTAPATSYSAAAMTTLHGVDMEVALDVTAQAQDWVNEPDSNYGLMLKADDSKSVKYNFIASDFSWESAGPPYPMLEVTYTPPVEITILHNNDGESDLLPDGDFGGVARFASVVDRVRTEVGDTHPLLLVTSGDNFLAGPQWTASLQKGVPFYDSIAMDLIGYNAMCIGNHDFDFGPDTLADFIEGFTASQVPFLSANLDFAAEPRLQALEDAGRIAASVIIEAGDEQFGIVGATTPNLTFISSPRNVVVGQDVQAAVQAEIDALEAAGVNKIILISHLQGIEEDIALAPQLSGVDVMIAGGGDELLANPGDLLVPGDEGDIYGPYPIVVQNADGADVPVVTTSGQYKYLGDLEVAFDGDGNLIFFEGGPIRVAGGAEPDAVEPDPDVQAQVEDPVTAFVAGLAENVIAGSEVGLDARRDFIRSRETNEGNLTTDSFLWKATQLHADFGAPAPDIAMCNGGGIRNDSIIPAGDFTELDTFDMLPFPNFLTIVPAVTPEDFKALLENAVSRINAAGEREGSGTGRFAQIAGLSFVYDSRLEAGNRVSYVALNDGTVMIEDGAIAPTARDINVAIVDFLARGGDEYFGGPPGRDDFFILGASYQQALADYIQAPAAEGGLEGLISAAQYPQGGEGRITNLALSPMITILHNNDGESDLLPDGDFGGVARFASVVDRVRTEVGDTHPLLLVTSGDNFLAGPQWTASLQKGVPFYDSIAMDLIGYDAMCIGNHDFDFGPDTLADFIEGFTASQVPFLSANLDFAAEPRLQALEDAGRIAASVIIEAGDEQFGFVGATTPNLTFISSPRNVVVGQDVQAAVQAEIDALEAAGVNKIILISHLQGIEEDIALAPQLSGVDVMIAGGGDELLANPGDLLVPGDEGDIYGPYPIVVQNADGADVPVVTTSGQYKYLGDLEVAFDGDGNLIFFEGGPIRVAGGAEPDAVEPDPDVQAQVEDPVTAFVAGLAENVIAGSEVGLDARRDFIRSRETNEGNLTTDSFLWKATQLHADFGAPAPDIAMCNGGGIRNDSIIPAGDFTELDTFDMLPFPNFLTIVPAVTPEDFKALLENAVSRINAAGEREGSGTGRFAQIAGLSFVYDSRLEAGNRVSYVALNDGTVMIEDGAIAPTARDINVAIVDFLARGGDEYFGGPPGRDDFFILGASYQQALADYIQAPAAEGGLEGLISAAQYPQGGEGRITNLALSP